MVWIADTLAKLCCISGCRGGGRRRPQTGFMGVVADVMQRVCLTEDDASDIMRWSHCGEP